MAALASTGSSRVAVVPGAIGNAGDWDAGVDSLYIHRTLVPCC